MASNRYLSDQFKIRLKLRMNAVVSQAVRATSAALQAKVKAERREHALHVMGKAAGVCGQ
jgi:hypothetical protein